MIRTHRQTGIALLELISSLVILGALATIAVPTYIDLREAARQSAFTFAVGAIADGIKQAKANWMVRGDGQAMLNVPGYAGGVLDHDPLGYPVGTNLASTAATTADPSDTQCRDLIRAMAPTLRVAIPADAYPHVGYTHRVYGIMSFCYIHPLDTTGYAQQTPAGYQRHGYLQIGASEGYGIPRGTLSVWYGNTADDAYAYYHFRIP